MRTVLAIYFVFLTSFAHAQTSSSEDDADAFIVNNIVHILFHEAGHAVIDQFQLPVVGQEEDAADSFATVEVLELFEDPYFILLDSAEANFLMHEDVDLGDQSNYFGMHDLDVQRAYRIACVAVGTDAELYGDLADWAELPEDRQDTCVEDADLAHSSWAAFRQQIVKPEEAKPTPVLLSFKDAGTFSAERTLLKESKVMEDFRDYLATEFAWPQPLTVTVEQCDEANAFYDPEAISLIMCYEMVRFMGELEERRY